MINLDFYKTGDGRKQLWDDEWVTDGSAGTENGMTSHIFKA